MGAALSQYQARMQQQQARMAQMSPARKAVMIVVRLFMMIGLPYFMRKYMATSPLLGGVGEPLANAPPPGRSYPQRCAFTPGNAIQLYVYTSYSAKFCGNATAGVCDPEKNGEKLVWHEKGLWYDWRDTNARELNLTVDVGERLLGNESMYAHIFVMRGGKQPRRGDFMSQDHLVYPLTEFAPIPKASHLHNLVSGEEDAAEAEKARLAEEMRQTSGDNETKWRMLWKPSLDIRLLGDAHSYPLTQIPPSVLRHYPVSYKLNVFWPPIYVSTFWLKYENYIPVNATVSQLPLVMKFDMFGFRKFAMMATMDQQMRAQLAMTGDNVEQGMDDLKSILTDTNPVLLGVTVVVSVVHSIFDFLAFKSDISFWRSRKSMAGVSVRTLTISIVSQVITFLYLFDNETSVMILVSCAIELAITIWKVGKAMIVHVHWKKIGPVSVPVLHFEDKKSYTESKTKAYDEQAMKYLYWLIIPLIIGYSVYSLYTKTYKSWYSWLVASLSGAVYAFGFVMMTPQLFINYKLKSVAHLPWKALVYKTLNTFIDDLFAFIIKMPTMHRIACFRDDIVFFIYLYQRWKYPVDKSRLESLQWEDAEKEFEEQQEAKLKKDAGESEGEGEDKGDSGSDSEEAMKEKLD